MRLPLVVSVAFLRPWCSGANLCRYIIARITYVTRTSTHQCESSLNPGLAGPQKQTFDNCWNRTFYRLDALPVTQPTVSKHWRNELVLISSHATLNSWKLNVFLYKFYSKLLSQPVWHQIWNWPTSSTVSGKNWQMQRVIVSMLTESTSKSSSRESGVSQADRNRHTHTHYASRQQSHHDVLYSSVVVTSSPSVNDCQATYL